MKVCILQNQMRTEKQMRAAALRHRIFFFLALGYKKKILCLKACENFSNRRGMRFFIFNFIFFLLQLAFASTHIRNQK